MTDYTDPFGKTLQNDSRLLIQIRLISCAYSTSFVPVALNKPETTARATYPSLSKTDVSPDSSSLHAHPQTTCLRLICLLAPSSFRVRLLWKQTSEPSSCAALTARTPLIWWLSH